jgi:hypothetical protein
MHNLKQGGLALHNYHDVFGSFPPARVLDDRGRPLYGWRALVLPFVDHSPTFNQIDFSQTWDSGANLPFHEIVIHLYHCPSDDRAARLTSYLAVAGDGGAWPVRQPLSMVAMTDGAAETILAVEAVRPDVHWLEPRDLSLRTLNVRVNPPQDSPPGISSGHANVAHVLLADGAVRAVPQTVSSEVLRALLTPDGGETVPEF